MLIKIRTEEKCRLDELLRRELPQHVEGELSNSKIRRLILSGSVSVNSRECRRPAFELRGRSEITVNFDAEKFFYEKQPDDIDFVMTESDVLYEDENLIFVNKPAFLPVEQTITGNRKNLHDAVVDFLWKRQPELRNPPYVGIMHRLDRETSGVILFTKTRTINKAVHDMFESHDFVKKYCAVCCDKRNASGKRGTNGENFTVEKYIGRISKKSETCKWGSLSEKNGGLYSKTDFKFCGEFSYDGKNYLVVECTLYTGRTHQIRVHLSEAGLPLLGDGLYGGDRADRIYLHACRLACSTQKSSKLNFDVRSDCGWGN